jgi:hypothetical protein
MTDKNKKFLFQSVGVLTLIVAAFYAVRWFQGDQNSFIRVIINLLIAAGLYYRSLNPIPPTTNRRKRK